MKLKAMTKTTAVSVIVNQVSAKSCPQPSRCGPTASEARMKNTASRPAEYQTLSMNAFRRLCPACCTKERIFKPITGQHAGHDVEDQAAEKAEENRAAMLSFDPCLHFSA